MAAVHAEAEDAAGKDSGGSCTASSQLCWWRSAALLTLASCWFALLSVYYRYHAAGTADHRWVVGPLRGKATTTTGCSSAPEGGSDDAGTLALQLPSRSAPSSAQQPEMRERPPSDGDDLLIQYGDSIYLKGDWDSAPVVLESHKLVFFTTAKVACTVWKQLFRRMMGYSNWDVEEYEQMLPWNPETNGLKYLYDYAPVQASEMMTSPHWTRAIFVREPKARFLSAYLDKALHHETFLRDQCCPSTGSCVAPARASLEGFLDLVRFCDNGHWKPQSRRMESKFWPHINFVGHMESLDDDARRLLVQVGAWEQYGRLGWGANGNESIFHGSAKGNTGQLHATSADAQLKRYFATATPGLVEQVEAYYAEDYRNMYLNVTRIIV